MVTFEFYNKKTHRLETTSLSDDIFKQVCSDCRKTGIPLNIYNLR